MTSIQLFARPQSSPGFGGARNNSPATSAGPTPKGASQGGGQQGAGELMAADGRSLDQVRADSYAHIMGHEQAHASAAGAYGGGININYDGNGVAVSGSVPISIPGVDPANPEAAVSAGHTIKGAALAPADPSGADMSVAAKADGLIGKAQILMQQKQQKEAQKANAPDAAKPKVPSLDKAVKPSALPDNPVASKAPAPASQAVANDPNMMRSRSLNISA